MFSVAHSRVCVHFKFRYRVLKSNCGPLQRRCDNMFAWGEDSQRGFRLKDGSNVDSTPTTDNGVHLLNVSYHITDLCGGHNVLAFVKSNGNSFIIRTNVSKDGRRARGKQSEHQSYLLLLPVGYLFTYNKLTQPLAKKSFLICSNGDI